MDGAFQENNRATMSEKYSLIYDVCKNSIQG